MKNTVFIMLVSSIVLADGFSLKSRDLLGQVSKNQVFNSFGCSGKNMSPQLIWEQAPKETKSFAITIYDPDAPTGSGWWHWIVTNIPAKTTSISTDASKKGTLPKEAIESLNDFGSTKFGGACPPKGDKPHRYVTTIYALDTDKLEVTSKSDSALVGFMINQHTIAKSSMISYYGR